MMVPNLGATPLAQNRISPRRSATSSVPFCASAAPASMRLIAGTWVAGRDVPIDASDLVADAREVPLAFNVAFFGGPSGRTWREREESQRRNKLKPLVVAILGRSIIIAARANMRG